MAACSCGCEIGAANNAAGVPNTSTAVATVLRIDLRIGPTSSPSAGTITRWMGDNLGARKGEKWAHCWLFCAEEDITTLQCATARRRSPAPPEARQRVIGTVRPVGVAR